MKSPSIMKHIGIIVSIALCLAMAVMTLLPYVTGEGVSFAAGSGAGETDGATKLVPVQVTKVWETTGTQAQLNEQKQPVGFTIYGGTENTELTPYTAADGKTLAQAQLTASDAEDPTDADCNVWTKTVYVQPFDVYSISENTDGLTITGIGGAWERPETSYEPAHVEPGVTQPGGDRTISIRDYQNYKYTHYVTFTTNERVKDITIKVKTDKGDRYECTLHTTNTNFLSTRYIYIVPFHCPFSFNDIQLDGKLKILCEPEHYYWFDDSDMYTAEVKGTLHRSLLGGAKLFANGASDVSGTIHYASYTTPDTDVPAALTITNNYRPIDRVEVYVQKKWEISDGSKAELEAQKQPVYFTVTGEDGGKTYTLPAYADKTGDTQVTTLTSQDATDDPDLWERSVWVPNGIMKGGQGVFFEDNGSYSFSIEEDASRLISVGGAGYWDDASVQTTTKTIIGTEPPNDFGHYRIAFRGNDSPVTAPRTAREVYVEFRYTDENGTPGRKAKLRIDLGKPRALPEGTGRIFNIKDVRIPTTWTGYKTTANKTDYFAIDHIELDGVDFTDKFTDEDYGNEYTQLRLYRNNPGFTSSQVTADVPLTTDMYRLLYKDIHGKEVAVGEAVREDTEAPCLKLTNTFRTRPVCKILTVENSIDMTSDYAVATDEFEVAVILNKTGDEPQPIADNEIPEAPEGVELEKVKTDGAVTSLRYSKMLGGDESFALEVPVGWTYTVKEETFNNYVVKYKVVGTEQDYTPSNAGVTRVMEEDTTVYISNSRDSVPLTGVPHHDHRGWIYVFLVLLLVGSAWIAVRVHRKKRLCRQ